MGNQATLKQFIESFVDLNQWVKFIPGNYDPERALVSVHYASVERLVNQNYPVNHPNRLIINVAFRGIDHVFGVFPWMRWWRKRRLVKNLSQYLAQRWGWLRTNAGSDTVVGLNFYESTELTVELSEDWEVLGGPRREGLTLNVMLRVCADEVLTDAPRALLNMNDRFGYFHQTDLKEALQAVEV